MARMATKTPDTLQRLIQNRQTVERRFQGLKNTRGLSSSTPPSRQVHMDEMRRSVNSLNVNNNTNEAHQDVLNPINNGICPDTPLAIDTRKLVSNNNVQ